jgi:UDP-3-O-[3-hydroxymyristoyl] glucosamine N-acyltransferase
METQTPRWTLGSLAQMLGGELQGPADLALNRPVSVETDDPNGIAFAESEKYLVRAEESQVGAVLIGRDARATAKAAIRVDEPRLAFFMLLKLSERPLPISPGVHPTAVVDPSASVDSSASVGPFAVVEAGAVIGAGVRVFPFCYVGTNCRIGSGTILYPHVTLYQDVRVGEDCIIHSGVVLGADGFGFVWDGEQRIKVPQVGGVEIGNRVELGVNTAIDRATAGETTIGDGTKIDNLVQVGHNDRIGEHTVIAGCSGLAGSVEIGDRCVIGGQVAFRDHVRLGDDVHVAGRSGIERDLLEPGQYFGIPALPALEAIRIFKATQRLPEILSRLRKLEQKVEGD